MLLDASEAAAREAGFRTFEMGATLTGIPLYARFGYVEGERVGLPLEGGGTLEIVKMTKSVA
jgi:hypothetical protein